MQNRGVKCGNCDKERQVSAFYFTCCSFFCEDCLSLHNWIKAYKGHHALALKDFGYDDFENNFKQPTFCAKHEKKELELFCQVCKTTICNSCALIDHEGHAKAPFKRRISAVSNSIVCIMCGRGLTFETVNTAD